MTKPHFLFEECRDDRPAVVSFRCPSESARYLIVGRSMVGLAFILGTFAVAKNLARSAHDWGDCCAIYGGALLLATPMILALYLMARALWVRRAVVIHLEEGTLSEIRRTPFKANASHHSLAEVRFVLIVADASIWHVLVELAGDSFVALGYADDEDHARDFARRAAAVLKVGIREDAPEVPAPATGR